MSTVILDREIYAKSPATSTDTQTFYQQAITYGEKVSAAGREVRPAMVPYMGHTTMAEIATFGEIEAWKTVPQLVATRYKIAANIQHTLKKLIKHLPVADPGYGHVYWNPDNKTAWAVLSDSDTEQTHQKWSNALQAISGVENVRTESEYGPYNDPDWVLIKKAAAPIPFLNKPYEWAGKLTGGPSPMSNAVVSGLLGAGLGYGGGWLAEKLMPERYVERGRLSKTLALLGGLGGAATALPAGFANAGMNRGATGNPQWGKSFLQGDSQQQMPSHELDYLKHYQRGLYKQPAPPQNIYDNPSPQSLIQTGKMAMQRYPVPARDKQANAEFAKLAYLPGSGAVMGSNGVPLRQVPVDSFNRAIWNDVHNRSRSSQSNPYGTRSPYDDNAAPMHTPPMHAAAAAGLVSGVQQMYGNRSLLSPMHFITGLAAAGVDVATARVAGGVLGALGGLTPMAQQKLQDVGVWSGMIRGVTGSVLGLK